MRVPPIVYGHGRRTPDLECKLVERVVHLTYGYSLQLRKLRAYDHNETVEVVGTWPTFEEAESFERSFRVEIEGPHGTGSMAYANTSPLGSYQPFDWDSAEVAYKHAWDPTTKTGIIQVETNAQIVRERGLISRIVPHTMLEPDICSMCGEDLAPGKSYYDAEKCVAMCEECAKLKALDICLEEYVEANKIWKSLTT